MSDSDRLSRLWRDPANWTMWGYHCKADPRVMVPKRNPALGWTMNWAHATALPTILGMVVFALAPTFVVVTLGMKDIISPVTSVVLAVLCIPLAVFMILGVTKRLARTVP